MFGLSKKEEEFEVYKKTAERFAKFERDSWNKKFQIKHDWARGIELDIESLCEEYDKLNFRYDVLLSLAKYYNPTIENDVEKQIKDLSRLKCKEVNK